MLWISRQKVYCLIELELTLNLWVIFFLCFSLFWLQNNRKNREILPIIWCTPVTLAITFLAEVMGLSYCTCVFLVRRSFTWYHNFLPLDLEVWSTFEKLSPQLLFSDCCRLASVVVFWELLLVMWFKYAPQSFWCYMTSQYSNFT